MPICSRALGRPLTVTVPVVGGMLPVMIFNRVDLTAPLRPMIATFSGRVGTTLVTERCATSRRMGGCSPGANFFASDEATGYFQIVYVFFGVRRSGAFGSASFGEA